MARDNGTDILGGGHAIPLPVDLIGAGRLSLPEAVVLQQLHYWLRRSKNVRDGHRWVYKSYRGWVEQDFPWWSERNVRRLFRSLETARVNPQTGETVPALVVATAHYNQFVTDRTKWYRIDYTHPWLQNSPQNASGTDMPHGNVLGSEPEPAGELETAQNASGTDMPHGNVLARDAEPEKVTGSPQNASGTNMPHGNSRPFPTGTKVPHQKRHKSATSIPETTPEITKHLGVAHAGADAPSHAGHAPTAFERATPKDELGTFAERGTPELDSLLTDLRERLDMARLPDPMRARLSAGIQRIEQGTPAERGRLLNHWQALLAEATEAEHAAL